MSPQRVEISVPSRAGCAAVFVVALFGLVPAWGQLSAGQIAELAGQGAEAGWTFTVGANPATSYSLDELCGLVEPPDWAAVARSGLPAVLRGPLPEAFDWRDAGGCPPVRNQGGCGGCWAFATVGPLECAILIQDGLTVDLSEQWLVSCNQSGYGCDGGWFAHQYHLSGTDPCADTGAVLEANFPYVAADAPCNCPYAHAYTIDGWAYVDGSAGVPAEVDIKTAIYNHGPVACAVRVTSAFQAYDSGIFNDCSSGAVNHGVVLVGWDDNGGNGYWILRNSWGAGWGEGGYMRIAYNCSEVGYATCYITYSGTSTAEIEVTPAALDFGEVAVGGSATLDFTVKNVGTDPLAGEAGAPGAPFSLVGPSTYTLAAGEATTVSVQFQPTLLGAFERPLSFTGGGGATALLSGSATGSGAPGDQCPAAPPIGDGTYTASNLNASTEHSASCGGGGSRDVWWRFVPPASGLAIIDTYGSSFDTVLSVYDACDGTELACNDDAGGGTSAVELGVLGSQSYYVRVAGVAGQSGTVTLNVSTDPQELTFSGRVVDPRSQGIGGVLLSGLGVKTNSTGHFSVSVPFGFSGTVRPQKSGWTFDPGSRSFAGLSSDQSNVWFVGSPTQYAISGYVRDEAGRGVSGVALSGFPVPVTTNFAGHYSVDVDYGFRGTILPALDGYMFEPSLRLYDPVTAASTAQDYTAYVQTGALQVTLLPSELNDGRAYWRSGDGAWHASGETAESLPVGAHVLEYAVVPGYVAPPAEVVHVDPGPALQLTREYSVEQIAGDSSDSGVAPDDQQVTDVPEFLAPPVAPFACGGGLVGMLPLMGLGLGIMRRRFTR